MEITKRLNGLFDNNERKGVSDIMNYVKNIIEQRALLHEGNCDFRILNFYRESYVRNHDSIWVVNICTRTRDDIKIRIHRTYTETTENFINELKNCKLPSDVCKLHLSI